MIIKLLIDGGAMKPGPAIAQKMGPLGLNMGKVIADVNSATKEFAGMKVPVDLDIDTKTKTFKVIVASPPTSEMLKKEFGAEKGSGTPEKYKIANAAIEQIIKIAKIKEKNMLARNLKLAVKTVLGSCVSVGILVESKDPKEVTREVEQGVYDELIKKGTSEASKEKLEKLQAEFEKIKIEQERKLKEELAAIEAKKAEKAAAAAAAGATAAAPAAATTAATATTAAATAAAPAATATAAPAKAEAKKAEKKK